MKKYKMNNGGFTLVELLATIVLLALVIGIASYSINAIIKNSQEKNYQLEYNAWIVLFVFTLTIPTGRMFSPNAYSDYVIHL